jgi:hypothetical protein
MCLHVRLASALSADSPDGGGGMPPGLIPNTDLRATGRPRSAAAWLAPRDDAARGAMVRITVYSNIQCCMHTGQRMHHA